VDAGLAGKDRGEFLTTPLGIDGAMLEGVLVNETVEVFFQRARDLTRSPGARAIYESLRAVAGKAMDPLAQGRIGKLERVGDGLQALPFDDLAHGLGTAEDAGFSGLPDEGIYGRERVSGKVQFEGPHIRVSSNKLLQKYVHPMSHYRVYPHYRHKAFPTQIFRKLLIQP
jgi:hypothetical protein